MTIRASDAVTPKRFAELMRRHRQRAGLTQEELAERAGLSREAISALERGDRRSPRRDTLQLLGDALGIDETERAALAREAAHNRRGATAADPDGLAALSTPALIGRDEAVLAAGALLGRADVRLLTLVGPGGVGKTCLARHLARHAGGMLGPDGAWFVDLALLRDPALVVAAIAQTVGVRDAGGRPLFETLREHLRDQQVLLVLDNCEHVLEAAPRVAELLAACPHLKVLATSREPLRVRQERLFPVGPLALPDLERLPSPPELLGVPAVALFVARAQDVRPDFRLDAGNARAVAEVCVALHGLPLALELVAARVRVLSLQAMRGWVGRLALLAPGPRDAPARHQSLRAALDWSYELLSGPEQAVFRRLGVFAGDAALEAAEAVCGTPGGAPDSVLDRLTSLADKSLVQLVEPPDGEPRFRLLEPLRAYALERLAEFGELDGARRCHAAYFLGLAETAEPRLQGPEQATWFARLEREHADLRAALRWYQAAGEAELGLRLAAAVWWFWDVRGHLGEGQQWLEQAWSEGDGVPPLLRARALRRAGHLALRRGAYGHAVALQQASLRLAPAEQDPVGYAESLQCLGSVALAEGEAARARALFEESLGLFDHAGNAAARARYQFNLGLAALLQGDAARAATLLKDAVARSETWGNLWPLAAARAGLAILAVRQGDWATATSLLHACLAAGRQLENHWGVAHVLEALAWAATAQGRLERAAGLFGLADAGLARIGARLWAPFQALHEQYLTMARAGLGVAAFEAAWCVGRTLSLERAPTEELAIEDGPPRPALTPGEHELAGLVARVGHE